MRTGYKRISSSNSDRIDGIRNTEIVWLFPPKVLLFWVAEKINLHEKEDIVCQI